MTYPYDYVLLHVVPRVHLRGGDAVGAMLQCRQARFFELRWVTAPDRLAERYPELPLLRRYLDAVGRTVAGDGPIGRVPGSERFHWLAATRSTVLQPSAVHTGVTDAPRQALTRIVEGLRS